MKLEAQQIQVDLGGRTILRAVDCALDAGEVVGLVGANGSGKSTLLRTLAGLLSTHAGQVRLEGRELRHWTPRQVAQTLAYLPQTPECHWPLSVERVVALGRLPFQDGTRDAEHVTRALEAVDALPLRERVISTLSGGERARVFLARALAGDPALLLVDEPTAGLDPFHQLQLMEMLRERGKEGRGVLVVLHDIGLAARFCQRLMLLHQGSLLADGPPQEVLSDPLLAQAHQVQTYRAEHENEPVLVPWKRVKRG